MALLGRLGLLGRTSTSTFIGFIIWCIVGGVVVFVASLLYLKGGSGASILGPLLSFWQSFGGPVLGLVFLWLAVRRFHDQDRPGWLALVPTGVGLAASLGLPIPGIVSLLVFLGFLIALFLPGTIGPNRYGPDPRGWKSPEHYRDQQRQLRGKGVPRHARPPGEPRPNLKLGQASIGPAPSATAVRRGPPRRRGAG